MGKIIRIILIELFSFFSRISTKGDDTQSINTVKSNEDGLFVKRLRSLFPAIEIKVEHVRFFVEFIFFFIEIFFFLLKGSNICWT